MNFFERLLSCNNFEDILAQLNSTPLKTCFNHVKQLYKFETLLNDYYYNQLHEIRSLIPDSTVCDFFLARNDVIKLKNFIKTAVQNRTTEKSLVELIHQEKWNNLWQSKVVPLPKVFKGSIMYFKEVITRHRNNQIPPSSQGGDEGETKKESLPFIIDLIFDSASLRHIENIYHSTRVEIIKSYLKMYQLVKGLEIIQRAAVLKMDMKLLDQFFLEGFRKESILRKIVVTSAWSSEKALRETLAGALCNASQPSLTKDKENPPAPPLAKPGVPRELKDFSDENLIQIVSSHLFPKISFQYEVATDNFLLDMLRPVKYIPFGPERVFGYLCGLTVEVFNLKLVLGGKLYRTGNNVLKERLRRTYV